MLFAVKPLAVVLFSIGPREYPMPMLLVILVFALVSPAVGPRKGSFSMHLIVLPHAFIDPTVNPSILPEPVNVVGLELSAVFTVVCGDELSLSTLHPVDEEPFVVGPVLPSFLSLAVLEVMAPLAFINKPL
jgi:hypothetical protein